MQQLVAHEHRDSIGYAGRPMEGCQQAHQGRDLLLRLGYISQFHDAARRKPIPDQLRATYKVAPIPRNMDPRLHQGRREARVEALERTYAHKNTTYYVDAANYDHANNKAVATVVDHTLTEHYHSRNVQKDDQDLVIGHQAKCVVEKLKPSDKKEFFEAVGRYMVAACDYMRPEFAFRNEALINARVVDIEAMDNMSFKNALFFVERFPALLPQNERETRDQAINALEMESVKMQSFKIPTSVLEEERADVQWRKISPLKGEDGLMKFSRLAQVMLGILSVPHSNSECERQFSIVRKTRTEFRAPMSDKTLGQLLKAKCYGRGPCYSQVYSEEFLKSAKSATTKIGQYCSCE
ncbi:hypothetical protein MRX96_039088 [Rhipicephalus microplus]